MYISNVYILGTYMYLSRVGFYPDKTGFKQWIKQWIKPGLFWFNPLLSGLYWIKLDFT